MARIRTIKPEFCQSETLAMVSRDARLLFVLLWTIVDDDGRSRANSRMLASLLYPYDDDVPRLIDGWLDELERNGSIRRYEAAGSHYLDIPNWLKHQKIDHASKSKLPPYREPSREIANPPETLALDLDLEGIGKEHTVRSGDRTASELMSQAEEVASEEDLDDIPHAIDRRRYPEAFEALWLEYRPIASPNASKHKSLKAWERLSAVDREACWAGLVEYVLWLQGERSKRADYPAKHLATFINERGWEPFLENAA